MARLSRRMCPMLIGAGAGATRILDFLLAARHLRQGAWQLAARTPKIYLACQGVEMRTAVDQPLQWCVRDQTAVSIMLPSISTAGNPGGNAALAMMCSGSILRVAVSKYTKLPLLTH
jgi:hypothetical protein